MTAACCAQNVAAGSIVAPGPDTTATQVSIDLRSSRLTGRFLLDSHPHTAGAASSYAMDLVGAQDPDDSLSLGVYSSGGFSVPAVAGPYRPRYTYLFGAEAPRNANQLLPGQVDLASDLQQDIDVGIVEVTAAFLHNGLAFPANGAEAADFYLRPQGSGQRILLGRSNLPASTIRVLPGRYDVIYEYRSGSSIPINQGAVVVRDIDLTVPAELNIEVNSSVLESRVTLNGQTFPNSAYDYGSIHLVDPEEGNEVHLGQTYSVLPDRRVIHGRYDVHYRSRESQGITPMNPEAVIARGIVVSETTPRVSLDVETILVSGDFRINGHPPVVSAYEYARIGLRFLGTSAVLPLGETYGQSFTARRIIPGQYQAIYSHREGDSLPANTDAVFMDGLSLTSSGSYTLNIPVVTLTLDLSLNGSPFPNSAYDYARIEAVPRQGALPGGSPVLLGQTYQGPVQVPLLAGSYDFSYASREYNGNTPANRHAWFLRDSQLTTSTTLVHDFKASPVRVNATLNGSSPPALPAGSAELFIGQSRQDRVSIGLLSARSELGQTLLLHGHYDAYYSLRDAGDFTTFPLNRDAVVDAFAIGSEDLFENGFE